jgi:1-acyl-sn-glycerol-3-phosphate acyltransferase
MDFKKLFNFKQAAAPVQAAVPKIKKDAFGNFVLLKRALIGVMGLATYARFNVLNKLRVEGMDYLRELPQTNVLFVSNHQTYYADVMALYHIFCSVKWQYKDRLNNPLYFLTPRDKTYYVAAEETIKDSGWLPKIFAYAGAVTVKRSWRAKGQDTQRGVDMEAPEKIRKALTSGWVVNFPQGTTKPYAPVRKGVANLIKEYNPIVVPVVIDGFRRAFDKKGLKLKKLGTTLNIKFKQPIYFDESYTLEEIHGIITKLIEQEPERSPEFERMGQVYENKDQTKKEEEKIPDLEVNLE